MDCSLPASSIHGIFRARVLEWVATSFSRGPSRPRNQTWVSGITGRRFIVWATREAWPGLRDAQISGETFLGMSERLFLEEIMSGNHPVPWEPEENRKTGRRQIHSLCLSWEIYLLLPWTSIITQEPWFSVGFPTQIMAYTISNPLTPPLFPRLWTQAELQHTDFPGLPACRCQIMGLLCHHNHVSQIL